MRGVINDGLRWLIGIGLVGLGLVQEIAHRCHIRTHRWNQTRLKKRYGIGPDTPILHYGPQLEQHIQHAAHNADCRAKFALISGSTARPKRILYTNRRLRQVKWTFLINLARCYQALPIRRKSLYIFSALNFTVPMA